MCKELKDFATCELSIELEKREGVEVHYVQPYQDFTVNVNGPAVVLVVIDQSILVLRPKRPFMCAL